MATNWALAQAVVPTAVATPAQSASVTVPTANSLLTTTAWFEASSSGPTSFTISDNSVGQGGWTPLAAIQTSGAFSTQSFYKISDGTESTVASTGVGYSSAVTSHRMQVDNFRVTGGGTIGIDLTVSGKVTASSFSTSPASGSSQPSNIDELALINYGLLESSFPSASSASFTGTSALAAASPASSTAIIVLACYWVGGVQASSIPTTNVFKSAIASSGTMGYNCATFYYVAVTPTSPVAVVRGTIGLSQSVNRAGTF